MGDKSKIHWTDASWNPVTGCSHVSPGCQRCYAETLSLRQGWSKLPWKAQNAKQNVVFHPDRMELPRRWKKPRRIFVNSMSDVWHELVPFEFIDQMFEVMEATPHHVFQLLTKRPARMLEYLNSRKYVPPYHIWFGTSVEDQRRADERIPLLTKADVAIRFLSCEPLLDRVNLRPYLFRRFAFDSVDFPRRWTGDPGLNWVIVGGESGPGFRSMHPEWARTIRDDCVEAGVPFFFKQSSGFRPGTGRELDGRLWEEFPVAA